MFSICTRIGTRRARAGSASCWPFIGHTATGVGLGVGDGLGVGLGVGVGVGDGVGVGLGLAVGVGRRGGVRRCREHDGTRPDENGDEEEATHAEHGSTRSEALHGAPILSARAG